MKKKMSIMPVVVALLILANFALTLPIYSFNASPGEGKGSEPLGQDESLQTYSYSEPPETEWNRTYGRTEVDVATSVVQTCDGGYILAGGSPYGGTFLDSWLVRTNASGDMLWNKPYEGAADAHDKLWTVVQTCDGGYAAAGSTNSFGAGGADFWLAKIDSSGNDQWNKTYGGIFLERAYSFVQTCDEGYALLGHLEDYFWLVKTDASGNMEWNQTYDIGSGWPLSVVQTGDGGYAIAGATSSFGAGGWDFWLGKTDSYGNMLWNRTYGGTESDLAESMIQTCDGGYALAGYTDSFGAGYDDFWLVKTDPSGNHEWNKTYGGADYEGAKSVVQTCEGGYAIAGSTSTFGAGDRDAWLVKTDASGNHLWNRTFGGANYDCAYSMVQTCDGGYAIAGNTKSFGGEDRDFWLIKLAGLETHEWSKTYGGTSDDSAGCTIQTCDGGYALTGYTRSFGAGGQDFWLVKTDSAGTIQWNKTYGRTNDDTACSVVQTCDGGYAIAGNTKSYGAGGWDFWLVKTDASGNHEWNKTYGGTDDEIACSVVETCDGGYAIAGRTWSYDVADGDFWLVKTDENGTKEWSKNYGGAYGEYAYSVVQTCDGGYAIAGLIWSSATANDFWLVKTDENGTKEWSKKYGGTGYDDDVAYSVVQTCDGGYAIAGRTRSFGAGDWDFWLVKTDASGNKQWDQTYGGTDQDEAHSVVQTCEGGYAIAGYTKSFGAGDADAWLVRTNASGNHLSNRTYGGAIHDTAECIVRTCDGGYAMGGGTNSFGTGDYDVWLIKSTREVKIDVAVTSVAPFKTVVGQGYFTTINVTVENQGTFTENFNVTTYYNSNIINCTTLTNIPSSEETTITITWNTTSVTKGNYTIKATATSLPGETETLDNTLAGGWVVVTIPGDINGDCLVEIQDWVLVLNTHIWSYPGHPDWNPNADINNDGIVDIQDIVLVRKHFWEHC